MTDGLGCERNLSSSGGTGGLGIRAHIPARKRQEAPIVLSAEQSEIAGQSSDRSLRSIQRESEVAQLVGGRLGDLRSHLLVVVRLLAEGGKRDHADVALEASG